MKNKEWRLQQKSNLVIFGSVMLLLGCNLQKNHNPEISGIDFNSQVKNRIRNGFNKYNEGLLSKYDSCIFVNFIDNYNKKPQDNLVKYYANATISNYTCPFTNFSFTLLKNGQDSEYSFYGNYDIYYLRHSIDPYDSGKLVIFNDRGLNSIVNKYIKFYPEISHRQINERLKFFLYQLYFENIDDLSSPIFHEVLQEKEIKDYISKDSYKDLASIIGSNLIIFEERNFGIIIFKWSIVKRTLLVEEYLIPFRKLVYLRSDGSPDFLINCN